MFLDRLCCFRMFFILLKAVVEVEKVVQAVRFAFSLQRKFEDVLVQFELSEVV